MGSVGETWLDKATLYGEGATPHSKFCVVHWSMCKRARCTDYVLCIALVVLTLRHMKYTHTETHTDTHCGSYVLPHCHTDTHTYTHRHTLFVFSVCRFSVWCRNSVTVSPSEEVPLATYSGAKERLIPDEASDACACVCALSLNDKQKSRPVWGAWYCTALLLLPLCYGEYPRCVSVCVCQGEKDKEGNWNNLKLETLSLLVLANMDLFLCINVCVCACVCVLEHRAGVCFLLLSFGLHWSNAHKMDIICQTSWSREQKVCFPDRGCMSEQAHIHAHAHTLTHTHTHKTVQFRTWF